VDNPEQLTVLSLCTGYGGLELGLARALADPLRVVAVEIEAYGLALLEDKASQKRLAIEALWPDLKTFPAKRFRGCFDFILAGFPCQPFSVAGKRAGGTDDRYLWPYIRRIIQTVEPLFIFLENVPGLLSGRILDNRPDIIKHLAALAAEERKTDARSRWYISQHRQRLCDWLLRTEGIQAFPGVYLDLRDMGYSVEAGLFTAEECGAPHRRQRLFILAHNGSANDAARVQSKTISNRSGLVGNAEREPGRVHTIGRDCQAETRSAGEELADAELSRRRAEDTGQCDYTNGCNGLLSERQEGAVGLEQCGKIVAAAERTEPGAGILQITPAGIRGDRFAEQRWPARPGEQQYEWEEPRVVANSAGTGARHKGRQTCGQGRGPQVRQGNGQACTVCPDAAGEGQAQSRLGRAANGAGSRVDRLRLLGNGVSPYQAEKALRALYRLTTINQQLITNYQLPITNDR